MKKTQIKNKVNTADDLTDDEPEIYITTYNLEKFKKYVDEKGAAPARDSFESANNILTVLLYEKDFITLNNIADKTFLAAS